MKKALWLLVFSLLISSGLVRTEELKLVTLQYPPYQYEENGQVKGMVVDIVNEALTRLGMTATISVNAWPRSLSQVKEGKADAIFTAYKNPEREKFLDYSSTILMPQEIVLFVHKDSRIGFTGDLQELAPYKFGLVRKISYGDEFDQALKSGVINNFSEATNLEQNVKKFGAKRVDILISNKYTALSMFKTLGMSEKFKQIGGPVQSVPSYIAFSKARNRADLRDKFDLVLRKMMGDGTYDQIINEYSE